MDESPQSSQSLEEILLKDDPELDFIRMLTMGCIVLMLAGLGWYGYQIFSGEISLVGPGQIVLEQEEDFDSLIQLDQVSNLKGDGVKVCIVDTGIDMEHPDLANVNLGGWSDFIASKNTPYDDEGHGTMMAGILVADGGLTGVSTGVELFVAKALASNGSGEDAIVSEAVDWCISSNVHIISLSLGGAPGILPTFLGGDALEGSVDDAYSAGIVVVAAAGNDGENDDGDVASPGSVSTVICVGGVDERGALWSGSSVGDNNGNAIPFRWIRFDPDKKPEVVAPGKDVPVIMSGGGWGLASGTSAATVYVTGAIALMFEQNPELKAGESQSSEDTLDDIKQWIMDSSKPKDGQTGHDNHYGYGLLQIEDLIEISSS